ncbi:type II secretion system F family protein [Paenibacillus harenae]|uniref:Tight adherence protein B n=1 Tax=Paenibacillus harenae TaxID=306543 RepID=A0ABT9TUY3_PAEHA|nr:type II secretion system F family protein [Paenibacillus harenae]MDQ0111153.1 tight adherence protein B [Paenibacillus harenae]
MSTSVQRIRSILYWCGWESESSPARPGLAAQPTLPDYREYKLSRTQFASTAGVGALALFAAAYLFYHSLIVAALLAMLGVMTPRYRRAALLQQRKDRLKLQFKEALFSLVSSLAAGRSIENAFVSTLDDLRLLYPDPRTELLIEFQIISNRLDNAVPLEQALRNFAERAGIDEITQFADALAACKRSGGDLIEVMKRTSAIIGEKLETEQEIAVMIAQKRFEGKIMMAVPFVFLGFLSFAAPDYMAPLYSGPGYLLLTAALGMLLFCFWIMSKMMDIRM